MWIGTRVPTVCQHGGVTTTETTPSSHDAGTSERSPVPLRIGALEVPTPVELAPMAGVTNASFRRLCREMAEAALPEPLRPSCPGPLPTPDGGLLAPAGPHHGGGDGTHRVEGAGQVG